MQEAQERWQNSTISVNRRKLEKKWGQKQCVKR